MLSINIYGEFIFCGIFNKTFHRYSYIQLGNMYFIVHKTEQPVQYTHYLIEFHVDYFTNKCNVEYGQSAHYASKCVV